MLRILIMFLIPLEGLSKFYFHKKSNLSKLILKLLYTPGIMPHCITSDTLERPLKIMPFDGMNYEQEMKGEKFNIVQEFSKWDTCHF